jgi:hypothetical protein
MSKHPQTSWLYRAAAILTAIVVLVVLYVLSTGPAFWLVQREWLSYQAHTAYSQPAFWLADHCGRESSEAYRRYLDFWVPYDREP